MILVITAPAGGNWCWYGTSYITPAQWLPAGTDSFTQGGCITAPYKPPHPLSWYQARHITSIGEPPPPASELPQVQPAHGATWCYYLDIGAFGGINSWEKQSNSYGNPWHGTCTVSSTQPAWVPKGAPAMTHGSGSVGGGAGLGILAAAAIIVGIWSWLKKRTS